MRACACVCVVLQDMELSEEQEIGDIKWSRQSSRDNADLQMASSPLEAPLASPERLSTNSRVNSSSDRAVTHVAKVHASSLSTTQEATPTQITAATAAVITPPSSLPYSDDEPGEDGANATITPTAASSGRAAATVVEAVAVLEADVIPAQPSPASILSSPSSPTPGTLTRNQHSCSTDYNSGGTVTQNLNDISSENSINVDSVVETNIHFDSFLESSAMGTDVVGNGTTGNSELSTRKLSGGTRTTPVKDSLEGDDKSHSCVADLTKEKQQKETLYQYEDEV